SPRTGSSRSRYRPREPLSRSGFFARYPDTNKSFRTEFEKAPSRRVSGTSSRGRAKEADRNESASLRSILRVGARLERASSPPAHFPPATSTSERLGASSRPFPGLSRMRPKRESRL